MNFLSNAQTRHHMMACQILGLMFGERMIVGLTDMAVNRRIKSVDRTTATEPVRASASPKSCAIFTFRS
jgi:hypothetical protein